MNGYELDTSFCPRRSEVIVRSFWSWDKMVVSHCISSGNWNWPSDYFNHWRIISLATAHFIFIQTRNLRYAIIRSTFNVGLLIRTFPSQKILHRHTTKFFHNDSNANMFRAKMVLCHYSCRKLNKCLFIQHVGWQETNIWISSSSIQIAELLSFIGSNYRSMKNKLLTEQKWFKDSCITKVHHRMNKIS